MKSWIRWISYFLIFTFLITGLRACVQDPNLGDITYGFPIVFMDSDYVSYGVNPMNLSEVIYKEYIILHKPKTVNFYKNNLIINIVFWMIVFGIVFLLRNKFVKYTGEINYGLFFAALFIVTSFFMNAFDYKTIGFLSIPGFFVLFYTGILFQAWIDSSPNLSHFVYETLKEYYPFKDDLPSRVGFIFALLVYFLLGVIIYKIKVRYFKKRK